MLSKCLKKRKKKSYKTYSYNPRYVSQIATFPSRKDLLVSAGGDEVLLLWNWFTGELVFEMPIREFFTDIGDTIDVIALRVQGSKVIVVAAGCKEILVFSLNSDEDSLKFDNKINTNANIIDIAVEDTCVYVSLDCNEKDCESTDEKQLVNKYSISNLNMVSTIISGPVLKGKRRGVLYYLLLIVKL